jgi:acyl carrier protein
MTRTDHLAVHEEAIFQEVANILKAVTTDYCIDFPLRPETTIQSDLDLESFDIVRFGLALSERYGGKVNLSNYLSELDLELLVKLTLGDVAHYVAQQTTPEED